MAEENQRPRILNIESMEIGGNPLFDDDGRPKRTGTTITATAHIITAVIGCGVLSLAWAIAQLGWILGIIALLVFSVITCYNAALLADGYRSPDPISGRRNYTYRDVVKSHLGETQHKLCAIAQHVNLVGVCIGYTVTASISMGAIRKSNCFHNNGHDAECHSSNNIFMVIFGAVQIILSQIPNFSKLTALSMLAAIMSFAYSIIGICLSIAKVAMREKHVVTTMTGVVVGVDVTLSQKIWNLLQALGNIALAYSYSQVLVEIQDTLKSGPPENQVMKKANMLGAIIITIFYMLCGLMGYAAFGNNAPGNFLTGFGFYEPFWLIDIGNLCIVIHLVGAYQVFCQPTYRLVEDWCYKRWSEKEFVKEYAVATRIGGFNINVFRMLWRSTFVIVITLVAMIFPIFNSVLGLLGALSFFPLTVYFPIEVHISIAKLRRGSRTWVLLKMLSLFCFIISVVTAVSSIKGLITEVIGYKPFRYVT